MKKIMACFCMLCIMATPAFAYAADSTNECPLQTELLRYLDAEDYSGAYMEGNILHIKPIHTDSTNQTIKAMGDKPVEEPIFSTKTERVFYDDSADNSQQQLRKLAGRIWMNQKTWWYVDLVSVENGSIEVSVVNVNESKQEAIKKFANTDAVTINFNNIDKKLDRSAQGKKYFIADGIQAIACDGKLLELAHEPYMSNGFLMLPIRELCEILSATSNHTYTVEWVGGNDGKIRITSTASGDPVEISTNKNEFKWPSHGGQMKPFEGTMENRNGTIYLPYSFENLLPIFHVRENAWDNENRVLTIIS